MRQAGNVKSIPSYLQNMEDDILHPIRTDIGAVKGLAETGGAVQDSITSTLRHIMNNYMANSKLNSRNTPTSDLPNFTSF